MGYQPPPSLSQGSLVLYQYYILTIGKNEKVIAGFKINQGLYKKMTLTLSDKPILRSYTYNITFTKYLRVWREGCAVMRVPFFPLYFHSHSVQRFMAIEMISNSKSAPSIFHFSSIILLESFHRFLPILIIFFQRFFCTQVHISV